MNQIKNIFIHKNSLLLVFFIFLTSEITTKLLQFYNVEHFRVSVIFKTVFIIFYMLHVILNFKTFNKSIFYSLGILTLYFILVNLAKNNIQGLIDNALYFAKYVYIFIVFDWYRHFNVSQKDKLYEIIEKVIIVNSVVILIAFSFHIDLFQTYLKHDRFGYNGLLYMSSQSSFIYIFILAILTKEYLNDKRFKIKYLLIVVASILTGAKAVYIFLFFLAVYLFFELKIYKNKYFYFFSVFILLIWNKTIAPILKLKFKVLVDLYNESGLLTMLLSRRDELFQEIITEMSDQINIIFGGFPFYSLRAELGVIDVFLFFGLIGGVYYLYLYYKYIIKDLLYMKQMYIYYVLTAIFIILFFAGNYFTNAITAIYIVASIDRLKQIC